MNLPRRACQDRRDRKGCYRNNLISPGKMKPKPRPLRSVSRPGEARRVTRSQSLDTDRASATLWPSGECHLRIATLQTETETLSNLIRVRGSWLYVLRHWLWLNRRGMGHLAAEFLPQRRCIIRMNLRVIASTRNRDIGHPAVESILSAQLRVHVNQDTVGSLYLPGVAGACISKLH